VRAAIEIITVMSTTDYLINAVLVLLVIRQIRGSKLDLINLVLPLVLVVGAACLFLKSFPTAGNDLVLIIAGAVVGALLGAGAAASTSLRLGADGVPFAKAGILAAVLWVVGIGFRMGFAYFSSHGAGPSIDRFSVKHSITSGQAWVAALVLMALSEVVARILVLRVRGYRLSATAA
jgi:hypothetical protein